MGYPIAPLYAEAKLRAAANGTKEADELLGLIPQSPGGRLLALDAETGWTLWKNDEDIFGIQLAVSDKYGVLLMCYQPAHQASMDSELGDRMAAATHPGWIADLGDPGPLCSAPDRQTENYEPCTNVQTLAMASYEAARLAVARASQALLHIATHATAPSALQQALGACRGRSEPLCGLRRRVPRQVHAG